MSLPSVARKWCMWVAVKWRCAAESKIHIEDLTSECNYMYTVLVNFTLGLPVIGLKIFNIRVAACRFLIVLGLLTCCPVRSQMMRVDLRSW